MYSIDLVSDNGEFLALKDEWNDAVERASVPHPFLRHEWLSTWWEAFRDGHAQQLHVIVVRRDSRMCAAAPLMFERAPMYGVPIRRLRLLHNDHTPRADVIVADHDEQAYRALWQGIQDDSQRWDVLQLSQLASESMTRDMFRRLAAEHRQRTGLWQSGAAPYLKLASSWKAYVDGLSSKFRQNLRNRRARLSRFGEPALEVISDPQAILSSHEDAQQLEQSGWKTLEGTAIVSDPCAQRFYRLLTERASDCPWLRMFFLKVGGCRVATSYAAIYQTRLFFLKTGYDPSYAQCSPFKLLTYFAMEYAFAQGLTEVDFLGDTEPWKLEWTTTTRAHDWLFVFSGTPRGRLLHPLKFQFIPALRQLCTSQPSRV
jgi:CelD/BcsL family acetyltransferase involved in cellulose biosynthesis